MFGHGLVKSLELILLFSFGFAFICIFMDGNRDGFACKCIDSLFMDACQYTFMLFIISTFKLHL